MKKGEYIDKDPQIYVLSTVVSIIKQSVIEYHVISIDVLILNSWDKHDPTLS